MGEAKKAMCENVEEGSEMSFKCKCFEVMRVNKESRSEEQLAIAKECLAKRKEKMTKIRACCKAYKSIKSGEATDEEVVFVQENCQDMPSGKGGKRRRTDRKNNRKEAKNEKESNSPDLSGGKDKTAGKG